MALAFFFALLAQRVAFVGDVLDAETLERMRQREVFLREQMTKMLEEIERRRMDVQLWHFFARQPWEIWALAVLLLFLLVDFIQCIETQEEKEIQRETEMQRNSDGEMWEPVYHEGSDDVTYVSRFYYEFSIWPLKTRRHMCKVVEDLVDELLTVCQILPQSYFMPQLQPAVGVGVGFENTRPEGNHVVYRMLVPLKAPPGHVFHLEHGPKARVGVRNSCLRVELKCTCIRERVIGDMLCFVHHPRDKLWKEQMPSLLQTLCCDSYLDMEKTAAWFQKLVLEAWPEMPLFSIAQAEMLSSYRFCKIKLTTTNGRVIWIELMLGIQDKDMFLSFE
ncbi:inositol 1,4,5-trisphosphate receptor-interacting protein-like 1 [Excalfactoria chinensis]|uniref:inositol 1,4,5-trisphosphate receptor-interacting protein-like 1 n=1 Tax=Excalfactoria chinensis TaxID=46218 RepID=UPI003B3A6C74